MLDEIEINIIINDLCVELSDSLKTNSYTRKTSIHP